MKRILLVPLFVCSLLLIFPSESNAQNDNNEVIVVIEDSYPKSFEGYFNVTDIGMLIGSPDNARPAPFSFMTYNGMHLTDQLSMAFGLGVEFLSGSYMPLVLDTRYYFRNTNFSPFIQLYGGYALPLNDTDEGGWYYEQPVWSSMPYYDYYNHLKAKGGWLVNPGFGIRSLFSENFGLVFSVGYRLQKLYYEAENDRERQVSFNRLSMKIGITFK